MSVIGTRDHQLFPVLTKQQIDMAARLASAGPLRFEPGQAVQEVGDKQVPAFLVLDGYLEIYRHDGLSGTAPVTTYGRGQFSGEVTQLSGRPSLAGGRAGPDGLTVMAYDAAHLRALIIASAEVGEIIMRAFILRRVAFLETGGGGSVLIGTPSDPALVRLQGFLASNGYPLLVLDAEEENEGHALVTRLGIPPDDLPLLVCPNGSILKNPTDAEAAMCLGITPEIRTGETYDVAIVGAGPSGLAAAVYAASEGLRVIVLDERSAGGQAGSSSRIENYLGFPTGISGRALAGRALNQALKFGAEVAVPLEVECLSATSASGNLELTLTNGNAILARSVVIASGARYRRPDIPGIADLEGAGVSYWASAIEAKLCENACIALVGGGNSAGQAVAFLAPHVERLHLVVRRSLVDTMSTYLIERIGSLPNVEMHEGCEITALSHQENGLDAVIRNKASGLEKDMALRQVFMFVGADPNTKWIQCNIATDGSGFINTGAPFTEKVEARLGRRSLPLETTVPNVFAIGDVRAGSTKRVAAAVGEGAAVVSQIHEALRQRSGAAA